MNRNVIGGCVFLVIVYGSFFLLLCASLFIQCTPRQTVNVHPSDVQVRFDSCYQFAYRHSLNRQLVSDTLLKVLEEMIAADSLLLTERQRRIQATTYRTLGSHYLALGMNDKMLECMIEGQRIADARKDADLQLANASSLLTIYASWRMDSLVHQYRARVRTLLPQAHDSLAMADALIIAASSCCNEQQTDSALTYMRLLDRILETNPGLIQRFPPNLTFLYPYTKGWIYSCLPDSASVALRVLAPMYRQYRPMAGKLPGYEVVCFNIGRAYSHLGQNDVAETYYQEVLNRVEHQQSLSFFDSVDWLMEHYRNKGHRENTYRLLESWNTLADAYYKWCASSQLTAYYVQYNLQEKERQVDRLIWDLKRRRLLSTIYLTLFLTACVLGVWGCLFWYRRKRQMRILFEALMKNNLMWREQIRWITYATQPRLIQIALAKPEADEQKNKASLNSRSKQDSSYELLYARILRVMEGKQLFLRPQLSLDELAREVGTNRSQLSACINRMTQRNFNLWLAEYRVNYLLVIYEEKYSTNVSIEDLYTQAGFSSRASFYRQFKAITGLTPKQLSKMKMTQE